MRNAYVAQVEKHLIACLSSVVVDYALNEVDDFVDVCEYIYGGNDHWPLVTRPSYEAMSIYNQVVPLLRSEFSPEEARILLATNHNQGFLHRIRIFKYAWHGQKTIKFIAQQPLTSRWRAGLGNILLDLAQWMDEEDRSHLVAMARQRISSVGGSNLPKGCIQREGFATAFS